MFKKIEIWILYLVIMVFLLVTYAFGVLVRQGIEGRTSVGSLSIEFMTDPIVKMVRLPEEIIMFLLSGDSMKLSGNAWSSTRPFYKDAGFTGKPMEEDGYMLLSRYNSSLGESVIELVDLTDFSVIHTWNPDISEAHSKTDLRKEEFQDLIRDRSEQRYLIMHPYLNSDGSIILHGNYTPLMKIDHCGDLVWLNQEENFHHSIESDSEGNYWIPTRMFPTKISPDIVGSAFENFYDDAITKISPEGEIIYQKSVSEIFIENDMSYLLFSVGDQDEFITDPIHLNDIQPALSDSEYWKKGDLFLSLRHQSMIVQYRPSTNEVIWTGAGDRRILSNSHCKDQNVEQFCR